MPYNPKFHHRRSIRLKGYDYSQAGLYFITICVKNMDYIFGEIKNNTMILNDAGKIVMQCWLEIPQHFPDTVLHEYVIMPNHIHGIIELIKNNMDVANGGDENNVVVNCGDIAINIYDIGINGCDIAANGGAVGAKHFLPFEINVNDIEINTNDIVANGGDVGAKHFLPFEINVNDIEINTNDIAANINNVVVNGGDISINGGDVAANGDDVRAKNVLPLRRVHGTSRTIGSIIRGFKIGVTIRTKNFLPIHINSIWQRNYYEHIIRDEQSYINITNYIINNPVNWKNDKFYDG